MMHTRFAIAFAILTLIDLYTFQAVKQLFRKKTSATKRMASSVFWGLSVACLSTVLWGSIFGIYAWPHWFMQYSMAFLIVFYLDRKSVV